MEGKDFSGIPEAEFARRQGELDVEKWLASERAGSDLCGSMSWCAFCMKAEMYPCAKAELRAKIDAALRDIAGEEVGREAADGRAAAEEIAAAQEDAPAAVGELAEEELAEKQVADSTDNVPEGYERVVRYRRSFRSKLIQNEGVQDAYTELKNALLGYAGVKSRLCQGSENFRVGKKKIAKFAVSGKTLSLFLALPPAEFEESSFRFEDVSEKKSHRETPMRLRLTSRRAVRQAKQLLGRLAAEEGLAEVGCMYTDFHYEYKTDDCLIKKGLIRPYFALVRKKSK